MARQAGYFGLKNAKYAFKKADGSGWDDPVSMPFAKSLSLTTKVNTTTLYADDRKVLEVPSDQGYDGTFGLSATNTDYEIALGYAVRMTDGGIALLDAIAMIEHCIYFETTGMDEDKKAYAIKNWLFNVTTAKAGKSYTTKSENPEFGTHEMPIVINGTPLLSAAGVEYVDENGNGRILHIFSSTPGESNYETFGNSVPEPILTSI